MDIVIRALLAFAFIYLLTRLIGRRELGSLEPFDIILLVVIGDLIQQGVTQQDLSFLGGILAVGTFALATVALSYAGWRWKRLRPVLEGVPLVLVENGRPIERNLRRERITPEEVAAEARIQGIESLRMIKWAVLETDGQISFIRNGG